MLLARGGGSATLLAAPDPLRTRTTSAAALGCDPGRFVDARAARGLAMAAFRHALTIRGDSDARGRSSASARPPSSRRGEGERARAGRTRSMPRSRPHRPDVRPGRSPCPPGHDRAWEERINALLLLNLLAFGKVGSNICARSSTTAMPSLWTRSVFEGDSGETSMADLLVGRRAWICTRTSRQDRVSTVPPTP